MGPGGEVIIFFHSDEGHVGMALCVWQERVFTRVLAMVQDFSFAAVEAGSGWWRGGRQDREQFISVSLKSNLPRCPILHLP